VRAAARRVARSDLDIGSHNTAGWVTVAAFALDIKR